MSENSGTATPSTSGSTPWNDGATPWKTVMTHPWAWGYMALSSVTMVVLQVSFVLQSTAIAGLAFAMYPLVHCVRDRITLIPDGGFSLTAKTLLLSTILNCLVALLVNQYAYLFLIDRDADVMGAELTVALATVPGWIYAVFSGFVGASNLFFLTADVDRRGMTPLWKTAGHHRAHVERHRYRGVRGLQCPAARWQ